MLAVCAVLSAEQVVGDWFAPAGDCNYALMNEAKLNKMLGMGSITGNPYSPHRPVTGVKTDKKRPYDGMIITFMVSLIFNN